MRDYLLRGLVLFGATAVLITELLSPFHLLRRAPLLAAWAAAGMFGAALVYRRRPTITLPALRPFEAACVAVAAAIATLVGIAAALSPPNSADAMAYHMPRVIYWVQSGSVAFFPTPYFNQITLQPAAEYLMLHTYLLSGGDRWVNFIAFGAFLGSIIGVSALAGALGLKSRSQAAAALICATLPNFILQASGAKNDSLLAFWLVAAAYFATRRDAPFLGLAIGLALATKATAYLFAPPVLLAILIASGPVNWRRVAVYGAAGVLLINTPQFVRNLQLSGSPLGYDSAHGDGVFRWRNEYPGWRSTVSNALRHLSDQLGGRSDTWNRAVYRTVVGAHRALGLDPQDPATTWRWAEFVPPRNTNHEANAANRWHLLLFAIAGAWAVWRGGRRRMYTAGLAGAFLLFCFYLKWQPYMPRLELPLFVLGAPLAAFLLESIGSPALLAAVCLFLASASRPYLLENWTRPLKGPHSLFRTSRDANYFSDMLQWENAPATYREAAARTAATGCLEIGLDTTHNQLEYPFQALLLERNPRVRFVHVGVRNASARYYQPPAPRPCAVLCLDCAGDDAKAAEYRSTGPPAAIGKFLLFTASPRGSSDTR